MHGVSEAKLHTCMHGCVGVTRVERGYMCVSMICIYKHTRTHTHVQCLVIVNIVVLIYSICLFTCVILFNAATSMGKTCLLLDRDLYLIVLLLDRQRFLPDNGFESSRVLVGCQHALV